MFNSCVLFIILQLKYSVSVSTCPCTIYPLYLCLYVFVLTMFLSLDWLLQACTNICSHSELTEKPGRTKVSHFTVVKTKDKCVCVTLGFKPYQLRIKHAINKFLIFLTH